MDLIYKKLIEIDERENKIKNNLKYIYINKFVFRKKCFFLNLILNLSLSIFSMILLIYLINSYPFSYWIIFYVLQSFLFIIHFVCLLSGKSFSLELKKNNLKINLLYLSPFFSCFRFRLCDHVYILASLKLRKNNLLLEKETKINREKLKKIKQEKKDIINLITKDNKHLDNIKAFSPVYYILKKELKNDPLNNKIEYLIEDSNPSIYGGFYKNEDEFYQIIKKLTFLNKENTSTLNPFKFIKMKSKKRKLYQKILYNPFFLKSIKNINDKNIKNDFSKYLDGILIHEQNEKRQEYIKYIHISNSRYKNKRKLIVND